MGYSGERPLGVGEPAFADRSASLHAAFAILAALHYRNRTGKGQYIDLSQWEAAICLIGEAIMDYDMNGRVMGTQGNFDPEMAPHGNYQCRGEDKWVSIAVRTEEEWKALCDAMGNPQWTREGRFSTKLNRLKNIEQLDQLVSQWTKNYTPYEITETLQSAGVAAIPLMNIEDQYIDSHFNERGIHVNVEHPKVGAEVIYGLSWKMNKTPGGVRGSAPLLGEHNNYVFRDLLGLSTQEIQSLIDEEVLC